MLITKITRRDGISCVLTLIVALIATGRTAIAEQSPASAPTPAAILRHHGVFVMPQPRCFTPVAATFDLRSCEGIICISQANPKMQTVANDLATELYVRTRVKLPVIAGSPGTAGKHVILAFCPDGNPPQTLHGISTADLADIGSQGYALRIDDSNVVIAARGVEGLIYGSRTLLQLAIDNPTLKGLLIRDWPALLYRGAHLDISRGQVPTLATLKRLVDVLAEAKINILELYIEHVFKFRRHPDISPPEGLSPEEGRELFDYAARRGIEVHPMFQVLGHSYHILNKPQYQHLRIGPCEKQPWIMTFDIRKTEAVAMVGEMIDELCETFPGKFFTVDITEIDCDGMKAAGMTDEQLTDLVFNYVLKLRKMVARHGMRLIIAQGPLDSVGHLAGMGSKLGQLPKDVIVGSYYCAGGPYLPAWKKDFPRLRANGLDFFAQAWIDSHIRILPWAEHAADFSDNEVRRGLAHGAIGSTTSDWGDEGHFHFTGQTWFPFMYHGASAWTGGQVDRAYFDKVFTSLLYGAPDDRIARAVKLAGSINGQKIKVRDAGGKIVEKESDHFWDFFRDPINDPNNAALADPAATGRDILGPANDAALLLKAVLDSKGCRNRDNLEQLLFGVRCYQATGRKLVFVGHKRDANYSQEKLREEMRTLADEYKLLQQDFKRLWQAEDRENDKFREMVGWFDQTIKPLEQMAKR